MNIKRKRTEIIIKKTVIKSPHKKAPPVRSSEGAKFP
jgi:hypothetical protein